MPLFAELCSSNWDVIEDKCTPKEFGDKLKTAWELTSGLAGFIAGFTYFVSNGVQEYEHETMAGGNIKRADVFVVIVMISFLFALISTLLGFLLIGVINQIGSENGKILRQRHSTICSLPEQSLVLSTFFMLLSTLISLGGHTNMIVWTITLIVGILFVIFVLYTYYWILGHSEIVAIMNLSHTQKQIDINDVNKEEHTVQTIN